MTPLNPLPTMLPICRPAESAEVLGNIRGQQWEVMGAMRGMGHISPINLLAPIPPIRKALL